MTREGRVKHPSYLRLVGPEAQAVRRRPARGHALDRAEVALPQGRENWLTSVAHFSSGASHEKSDLWCLCPSLLMYSMMIRSGATSPTVPWPRFFEPLPRPEDGLASLPRGRPSDAAKALMFFEWAIPSEYVAGRDGPRLASALARMYLCGLAADPPC